MTVSPFPGCCAFNIIHDLGKENGFTSIKARSFFIEELNLALTEAKEECGGVIITINEYQKVHLESIFRSVGFKRLKMINNPNTSNKVYIYFLRF